MAWPKVSDAMVCGGDEAGKLLDGVLKSSKKKAKDATSETEKYGWLAVWGAAHLCKKDKDHGNHGTDTAAMLKDVCNASKAIAGGKSAGIVLAHLQH
jgi:hypothetical protein